tara:strand:- start:482 stop:694 length:213 start_codon:yes stop_codon:yes gene_type:complete
MIAKEKAKELVEKFEYNGVMIDDIRMNEEDAKQCAEICVDEILESYNALEHYPENLRDYWQEVKQEINKL